MDTLTYIFFKAESVVKFCICEHDVPCTLEKIVMTELSEHVESFSSTTKNMISPLPQCRWPPNLAAW